MRLVYQIDATLKYVAQENIGKSAFERIAGNFRNTLSEKARSEERINEVYVTSVSSFRGHFVNVHVVVDAGNTLEAEEVFSRLLSKAGFRAISRGADEYDTNDMFESHGRELSMA